MNSKQWTRQENKKREHGEDMLQAEGRKQTEAGIGHRYRWEEDT